MPLRMICPGVVKFGSPMPSEMTSFMVAAMSKYRRMPEGGILRTLSATKFRIWIILLVVKSTLPPLFTYVCEEDRPVFAKKQWVYATECRNDAAADGKAEDGCWRGANGATMEANRLFVRSTGHAGQHAGDRRAGGLGGDLPRLIRGVVRDGLSLYGAQLHEFSGAVGARL